MNTDRKVIDEMLGDEFTKIVLQETGLSESAPEMQARFLAILGSNIMKRLALEILSVLPKNDHVTFEQLVGSGDMKAMREFLEPRIADLDEFMIHYANLEYEATKTEIQRLNQETA